jgi:putative phosphoribosyl transferase
MEQSVQISGGGVRLEGDLAVPPQASGAVLFAHGSGSGRRSPRNRHVAKSLQARGFAALLLDLLTDNEEWIDERTAQLRFDIPMLAGRLVAAIDWLGRKRATERLPIGLFSASTGGGAALVAAALRPANVAAIVSRGGRPDLAGPALPLVAAPTLLIVGSLDREVVRLNRQAMAQMHAQTVLELVPGATHLFEESGALDEVARLAGNWFAQWLGAGVVFSANGAK